MALSASTVFEVRTTGADTNGGGFVTGQSGTDYSQQAAAQYTFTDLASSNGTNASPSVTSASHNFVAADVGNIMQITAGTNWTAGFYQIVSVAANAATLDKACGTAASLSSGTYAVGGALATPGKAAGAMVGGNTMYIASGTYSITSASTNIASGCLSLPAAASTAALTTVIGYGAARNDNGTKPLLQAGNAISAFSVITTASGNRLDNLSIDGATLTTSKGFNLAAGHALANRCKAINCTNSGFAGTSTSYAVGCETTTCSTTASFASINCFGCAAHANTITGFNPGSTGIVLANCVASANSGASSDGFQNTTGDILYINCTAYSNGRHGFFDNANSARPSTFINCVAEANTGWGINASVINGTDFCYNCATFNNTSGGINSTNIVAAQQIGCVAYTATAFNGAGSNDFSLNNNSGGGASLRAAGIPGISSATYTLPGLSTSAYGDIGAVQHQGTQIPIIIGS